MVENRLAPRLGAIQSCFRSDRILYSQHARQEMFAEEFGAILDAEVDEAIQNGEIIEEYPDDKPYPSCLIFGLTKRQRPIHVVCALDSTDSMVIVITTYQPSPELWIENKTRVKK